jgi:hypothetical protein
VRSLLEGPPKDCGVVAVVVADAEVASSQVAAFLAVASFLVAAAEASFQAVAVAVEPETVPPWQISMHMIQQKGEVAVAAGLETCKNFAFATAAEVAADLEVSQRTSFAAAAAAAVEASVDTRHCYHLEWTCTDLQAAAAAAAAGGSKPASWPEIVVRRTYHHPLLHLPPILGTCLKAAVADIADEAAGAHGFATLEDDDAAVVEAT